MHDSVAAALVIVVELRVFVCLLIVTRLLLVINVNICVLVEVFDSLSVGSTDEVCLHVIYLAFRVHQVLLLLTLNLDHSHYHAVDHVHRFSLVLCRLLVLVHR